MKLVVVLLVFAVAQAVDISICSWQCDLDEHFCQKVAAPGDQTVRNPCGLLKKRCFWACAQKCKKRCTLTYTTQTCASTCADNADLMASVGLSSYFDGQVCLHNCQEASRACHSRCDAIVDEKRLAEPALEFDSIF